MPSALALRIPMRGYEYWLAQRYRIEPKVTNPHEGL